MGVNLITLLFGAKLLKYVPAAALNGVVGTIMFALAARSMAREEPIGETLT